MGEIFERVRPRVALGWTGERLTTETSGQVEIEHLHRYFLARELCRGCDVLDVASGEGYGSALLAQTAKSVVGVEISDDAFAHAVASYPRPNLRFLQGDARQLPLEPSSVDVVVSFETLEHFFEHDRFVKEARRVLRPGGRLIFSSPERDVYSPDGSAANPYHAHELSRRELEQLLRPAFRNVEIVLQRPMIGSALFVDSDDDPRSTITFERRGDTHYEASRGLPRSPYLIAIASDEPLGAVPHSVFIETSEVGRTLGQAAAAVASDAEKNALTQRFADRDEELARLRQELTGLREEQLAGLRQTAVAMEAEKNALIQRIADHNEELAGLREELAGLREKRVADHNEELAGLRQELADLREELATATENLSAVRAQRDVLRRQVNRVPQLLAQIATLEAKLGERKKLIRRLRAEVRRFLRRIGTFHLPRLVTLRRRK